jgi:class 3 adenylate cyclase
MSELKPKGVSILFMDVSGWSKLTPRQIHDYVTLAMPELAAKLRSPSLVNTWGDAIVATFDNAVAAAESALDIRDYFQRTHSHEGVAEGLTCRVALHDGDVQVYANPLRGGMEDIFGHAVHVAARLEPATAPGYVFCTRAIADKLEGLKGMAPKAWHLGPRELPKSFGVVEVYVVTGPNEEDPRPTLALASAGEAPAKVQEPTVRESITNHDDARMELESWVRNKGFGRRGESIRFDEVDEALGLAPGMTRTLLRSVVDSMERVQIRVADTRFTLTWDPRQPTRQFGGGGRGFGVL